MTIDSRRIVIPNSVLTNDSITNVTAMEKRRLEIKVGISYESDLLLAKQILRELIEKDPELLDREETQVFVDELGDSAVILGLRAWVKTEEFWNTLPVETWSETAVPAVFPKILLFSSLSSFFCHSSGH